MIIYFGNSQLVYWKFYGGFCTEGTTVFLLSLNIKSILHGNIQIQNNVQGVLIKNISAIDIKNMIVNVLCRNETKSFILDIFL